MRRVAGAVLVILAAVAIVYRDAPGAYFFEDDFQWLASRWAFHPSHLLNIDLFNHFYRPVIELYFWAGVPLFNGSAKLFHIANVILHAANVLLVFLLAHKVSGRERYGFLAALFFAVLPGPIEGIAWVSALAEAVSVFFGVPAVYFWIKARQSGSIGSRVAAVVLFALALLTHESSVVFLALLGIADLAFASAWKDMQTPRGWMRLIAEYAPFVLLTAGYLAIDLTINSRSYLVDEGHYRFGAHAIANTFSYIVSLYVGKRNLASYIAITIVLGLLLVRGSARVRFAIGWMLFGILPFAFFMWGSTSRYQYLAAVGFALLLADAIEGLDALLRRRLQDRARLAVVSLVAAAIAVRFMVFASEAVENFAKRTEMWRGFGETLRAEHPALPRGGTIVMDRAFAERHGLLYLEALVQWEFKDPTAKVVLR